MGCGVGGACLTGLCMPHNSVLWWPALRWASGEALITWCGPPRNHVLGNLCFFLVCFSRAHLGLLGGQAPCARRGAMQRQADIISHQHGTERKHALQWYCAPWASTIFQRQGAEGAIHCTVFLDSHVAFGMMHKSQPLPTPMTAAHAPHIWLHALPFRTWEPFC